MHTVTVQNYFVGTSYTITTPLTLFQFVQEMIATGGIYVTSSEFLPLANCGMLTWTA